MQTPFTPRRLATFWSTVPIMYPRKSSSRESSTPQLSHLKVTTLRKLTTTPNLSKGNSVVLISDYIGTPQFKQLSVRVDSGLGSVTSIQRVPSGSEYIFHKGSVSFSSLFSPLRAGGAQISLS